MGDQPTQILLFCSNWKQGKTSAQIKRRPTRIIGSNCGYRDGTGI